MQLNSIRIRFSPVFNFCVQIPARPPVESRMVALLLMGALLLLAGCAKKGSVAGLNELPKQAGATLKPVSNTPLLSTKIQPKISAPTLDPTAPAQKNAIIIYLDAQVTIPITTCTRPDVSDASNNIPSPGGSPTATQKITDFTAFPDLKDLTILQPPLVCKTRNGPWSALLTIEKLCSPPTTQNHLVLVGTPNSIQFAWYGTLNNHPPDFDFVGTPIKTDEVDLGPCNTGTGQ